MAKDTQARREQITRQIASYKNTRGKGRVEKYCTVCGRKFKGPPGGFTRSPEPGICDKHDDEYGPEDWQGQTLEGV